LFVLVLALAGSWGAYHGLSYLSGKRTPIPVSAGLKTHTTEPMVVARIAPETLVELKDQSTEELALLAGARRPAATQPAKKTVTMAPSARAEAAMAQANGLVKQSKPVAARKLLADYLTAHFTEPGSEPIRARALELGKQTIMAPKVFPDDPLCVDYKVQAGDTFIRLAQKNRVPFQFLCRLNDINDPSRLMEGQRMKLVKGPIHLKVVKKELAMYVFLQDTLFARYDVGLGKNDKTPVGKWIVDDRIRHPPYVDPDTKEYFGPNDPKNPTGGFWLRLRGVEGQAVGKQGFGIHGTTEPDSIKKFMSKGCIRMRGEDINAVFGMVTPGLTTVWTLP